jgi:hypothetical protein
MPNKKSILMVTVWVFVVFLFVAILFKDKVAEFVPGLNPNYFDNVASVCDMSRPIDTPPVISNVDVTDLSEVSATITWVTDVIADSQIEYGPTEEYGQETAVDSVMTTEHAVTISGLNPSTRYYFRVISANSFGIYACSLQGDFLTQSESSGGISSEDDDGENGSVIISSGRAGRRSQASTQSVEPPVSIDIPVQVPEKTVLDSDVLALSQNIFFGMRGESVRVLQEYLTRKSFLAPGFVTGYFGPITFQAVKKFQEHYGVTVTGYVGPLTRVKIFENW